MSGVYCEFCKNVRECDQVCRCPGAVAARVEFMQRIFGRPAPKDEEAPSWDEGRG